MQGFEARDDMLAYLEAHKEQGLTQASIAREIGVNPATFSKWLKGEAHGNVLLTGQKVQEFLDRESLRAQIVTPDSILPTAHAQSIQLLLEDTFLKQRIRILRSPSGLGKTTTCLAFAAARQNVHYFCCEPIGGDPTSVIAMLYEKFTKEPYATMKRREAWKQVTMYLRDHRDCMLIFDEAHYLQSQTLDLLRGLHDMIKMALVFVETSDMQEVPGASREAQFLRNPQLRNRTGRAWQLPPTIAASDVRLFTQRLGITSEAVVTWFVQKINNPFARYRELDRILSDAQKRIVEVNGDMQHLNSPELMEIAAANFVGKTIEFAGATA